MMVAVQQDVLKDNMESPTESGHGEEQIRKLRNLKKILAVFGLCWICTFDIDKFPSIKPSLG